jgi:hypothetical protein
MWRLAPDGLTSQLTTTMSQLTIQSLDTDITDLEPPTRSLNHRRIQRIIEEELKRRDEADNRRQARSSCMSTTLLNKANSTERLHRALELHSIRTMQGNVVWPLIHQPAPAPQRSEYSLWVLMLVFWTSAVVTVIGGVCLAKYLGFTQARNNSGRLCIAV